MFLLFSANIVLSYLLYLHFIQAITKVSGKPGLWQVWSSFTGHTLYKKSENALYINIIRFRSSDTRLTSFKLLCQVLFSSYYLFGILFFFILI